MFTCRECQAKNRGALVLGGYSDSDFKWCLYEACCSLNKKLSTWKLSLSCNKRTLFAMISFSSLFRASWVDCEQKNFL